MRHPIRLLAAAALSAAVFAPPAQAQDLVTQTFGGTTIWVGGGVQFLSLPDIKFTGVVSGPMVAPTVSRQKNSDFAEYGGAFGGGIETALGFWGNHRVTGAIKGFWTNMEDDRRTGCQSGPLSTCILVEPAFGAAGGFLAYQSDTTRDVDYWGGQVEFKFARAEPVHVRPNLYRNDYFIVGADVRGIDQDNKINTQTTDIPVPIAYDETLDTTYYGGYVGFGGEYTIPIIGGIGDGWGLRTFISGRAGLYSAETDYGGHFAVLFPGGFQSRLSRSNDELAFIGSVSFETRKPIGQRSSLSLWTDYEYISSVPEMRYADPIFLAGRPTRIEESDAFASRTMLRLNIGLGSSQLYQEPLK